MEQEIFSNPTEAQNSSDMEAAFAANDKLPQPVVVANPGPQPPPKKKCGGCGRKGGGGQPALNIGRLEKRFRRLDRWFIMVHKFGIMVSLGKLFVERTRAFFRAIFTIINALTIRMGRKITPLQFEFKMAVCEECPYVKKVKKNIFCAAKGFPLYKITRLNKLLQKRGHLCPVRKHDNQANTGTEENLAE